MTNPDNVGGLPELPAPDFMLRWDSMRAAYYVSRPNVGNTDVYTADQMHAYGELCRAAPAGSDVERFSPDCEPCSDFESWVGCMRPDPNGQWVRYAPAGSGEVEDWMVELFDEVYEREWNRAADEADDRHKAIIGPADRHATREAIAALLRKLQQGADENSLRVVAKRNLRSLINIGSSDKELMLKCLEELS